MVVRLFLASSLLGLTAAQAPLAVPSAPPAASSIFPSGFPSEQVPAPGAWRFVRKGDTCGIAAWSGIDAGKVGLLLSGAPTANELPFAIMTLIPPGPVAEGPAREAVTLKAGESPVIAKDGIKGNESWGRVQWTVVRLDREQAQAILSAPSLEITHGGSAVVKAAFGGSVGLEKIEECQAARLQAAGIDPSIAKTISRWPSFAAPPMSLFTGDDYPKDAMSNGAEGRVDAKLDVRADGVVSGCSIARSSGNASLDAKTCAILLERARVSPALDKDGKPVAAPVITSVAWRLSQG